MEELNRSSELQLQPIYKKVNRDHALKIEKKKVMKRNKAESLENKGRREENRNQRLKITRLMTYGQEIHQSPSRINSVISEISQLMKAKLRRKSRRSPFLAA